MSINIEDEIKRLINDVPRHPVGAPGEDTQQFKTRSTCALVTVTYEDGYAVRLNTDQYFTANDCIELAVFLLETAVHLKENEVDSKPV